MTVAELAEALGSCPDVPVSMAGGCEATTHDTYMVQYAEFRDGDVHLVTGEYEDSNFEERQESGSGEDADPDTKWVRFPGPYITANKLRVVVGEAVAAGRQGGLVWCRHADPFTSSDAAILDSEIQEALAEREPGDPPAVLTMDLRWEGNFPVTAASYQPEMPPTHCHIEFDRHVWAWVYDGTETVATPEDVQAWVHSTEECRPPRTLQYVETAAVEEHHVIDGWDDGFRAHFQLSAWYGNTGD